MKNHLEAKSVYTKGNLPSFLMKIKTLYPQDLKIQLFNLLAKYLPLFMLSHDLYLTNCNHINRLLSHITLYNILGNLSSSIFSDVLVVIIFFFTFLLFLAIISFYREYKLSISSKKVLFNKFHWVIKSSVILVVVLNEYFYEILFSVFTCKGTYNESLNEFSVSTDCYSITRVVTVIMAILVLIFFLLFNVLFHISHFEPFFISTCAYPCQFGGINSELLVFPLIQGYITLERNIPPFISGILRLTFRIFFLLYMIFFYWNVLKYIYSNKAFYNLVIFLNSFCCCSILLEFIPHILQSSNNVDFVVIRLIFQAVISSLILLWILHREKKVLSEFSYDHLGSQGDVLFEIINRRFYILYNFHTSSDNSSILLVLNKFFEHKHSCVLNKTQCSCQERDMETINLLTKEYFQHKGKDNMTSKLDYFFKFIDDMLLNLINKYDKTRESLFFKLVFLYAYFNLKFKKNHVHALLYLEKLIGTKTLENSRLMQLYFINIKRLIRDDFRRKKIEGEILTSQILRAYKNIKEVDKVDNIISCSIESLKEILYKLTEKNVSFEIFSEKLSKFYTTIEQIQQMNLNYNAMKFVQNMGDICTTAFQLKVKVYNELLFGKISNSMRDKSDNEFCILDIKDDIINENLHWVKNEIYMVLTIDHSTTAKSLFIVKASKAFTQSTHYEENELNGKNLDLIMPNELSHVHNEKIGKFIKENRNKITKDVFFVTKDNYAFYASMYGIFVPNLNKDCTLFCIFERNDTDFNAYPKVKINSYLENEGPMMFAVLNQSGDMTSINLEFEKMFGLTKKCIEIIKINFFSKILKVDPEEIHNCVFHDDDLGNYSKCQYIVRHLKKKLSDILDNIKAINYDDIKEHSQEHYNRLMKNFKYMRLGTSCNTMLNIQVLRTYYGKVRNEYIYFIKITFHDTSSENEGIKDKESRPNTHGMRIYKGANQQATRKMSNPRDTEDTSDIDLKITIANTQIISLSKKMFQHLPKIFNSSSVALGDITGTTSLTNAKTSPWKEDSMIKQYRKLQLLKNDQSNRNYSYSTNNLKSDKENLTRIKSLSINCHFTIMVIISMIFIIIYHLVFSYSIFLNRYEANLSTLNHGVMNIKTSIILASFGIIKAFLYENELIAQKGTFKRNLDHEKEFINTYLSEIRKSIYISQILTNKLFDTETELFSEKIEEKLIEIKTLHLDYSVHAKNYTLVDSLNILITIAGQNEKFNNMTFNAYPEEFTSNGMIYNINNLRLTQTSYGDQSVYFIMNNLFTQIIPFFDGIFLKFYSSLLEDYSHSCQIITLLLYCGMILISIFLCIMQVKFFLLSKNRLYEKYFINFNIIRLYNPYLRQKIKYLQEFISMLNTTSYENLRNLKIDLNMNRKYFRFDLDQSTSLSVKDIGDMNKKHRNSKFSKDSSNSNTCQRSDYLNGLNKYKPNVDKKIEIKSTGSCAATTSNNNVSDGGDPAKSSSNMIEPLKQCDVMSHLNSQNKPSYINTPPKRLMKESIPNLSNYNLVPLSNTSSLHSPNTNTTMVNNNTTLNNESTINFNSQTPGLSNSANTSTQIDNFGDNQVINSKNLLQRPSKFYLDVSMTVLIILGIIIVMLLSCFTSIDQLDHLRMQSYLTSVIIDKFYLPSEIALIYIATLLKNKEILIYSTPSYLLFKEKLDLYSNRTSVLSEFFSQRDFYSMDSILNYIINLEGQNSCETITEYYFTNLNATIDKNSTLTSCKSFGDGIYSKGLFLGHNSILKMILQDYSDCIHNGFESYLEKLNEKALGYIIDSQLNDSFFIYNLQNLAKLIKDAANEGDISSKFYNHLFYGLITALFVLLTISYFGLFMLLLRKKYLLICKIEIIMQNIIRFTLN